jgi:putative sigma-54 modulation protein
MSIINLSGISYEINDTTRKYVEKRVKQLEKYVPRHARQSLSVEVKLAEVNHDKGNKYEVEMVFTLPGKTIVAKDKTNNILAAVDIVEAKIKSQLLDYKRSSVTHLGKRRIMSYFKRSFDREKQSF